jgi:hypothetical protein
MKRFAATLLWFYTGWTFGATVDFLGGYYGVAIGPALGPILGTAAAGLFVGDPRGVIWRRHSGIGQAAKAPELTVQHV